jgi:hypothetical protein
MQNEEFQPGVSVEAGAVVSSFFIFTSSFN